MPTAQPYISQLNINRPSGMRDIAIYRDTLYILGVNNGNIYTLDIRKYRPIAKNTKTTIYPIFANEGDTIDLAQFSPDAERFTLMLVSKSRPTSRLMPATNWESVRVLKPFL